MIPMLIRQPVERNLAGLALVVRPLILARCLGPLRSIWINYIMICTPTHRNVIKSWLLTELGFLRAGDLGRNLSTYTL